MSSTSTVSSSSTTSTIGSKGFVEEPHYIYLSSTTEFEIDVLSILDIFQVINWLILIFTIIGCTFVLILFYKERKRRKIAHNFVISMCLADIIHGGLGCGMVIFFCTGLKLSDDRCPMITSILLISVYVSLFSLTTTAIDRYLAVCHPLMYRTNMTHEKSFGIIVIGWIIAIILGFILNFMRSEKYKEKPEELCLYLAWVYDPVYLFGYLELIMFICVGISCILYFKIYLSLRKMFKTNLGRKGLWSILDWMKKESGNNITKKIGILNVREVRVTLLMFSTVLSFVLCWMPCTIAVFLYRNEPNEGISSILISYAFPKFYSMINPVFYAYTIKDVRKALKITMQEVCCMIEIGNDNIQGTESATSK